jgi:hypothetical protein
LTSPNTVVNAKAAASEVGQRRDQRDVDAAPDHHDRHCQAEDAEHGHVLQQRQHVRGCQKAGEGSCEDGKQHRKNREYDSLLPEAPDSHPDFSSSFCCRRCWRALGTNASDHRWSGAT